VKPAVKLLAIAALLVAASMAVAGDQEPLEVTYYFLPG